MPKKCVTQFTNASFTKYFLKQQEFLDLRGCRNIDRLFWFWACMLQFSFESSEIKFLTNDLEKVTCSNDS